MTTLFTHLLIYFNKVAKYSFVQISQKITTLSLTAFFLDITLSLDYSDYNLIRGELYKLSCIHQTQKTICGSHKASYGHQQSIFQQSTQYKKASNRLNHYAMRAVVQHSAKYTFNQLGFRRACFLVIQALDGKQCPFSYPLHNQMSRIDSIYCREDGDCQASTVENY